MTALQELTKRLKELPEAKRERMAAAFLEEMKAQNWDQQIEADIEAGHLDHLIEEVNDDIEAGRTERL